MALVGQYIEQRWQIRHFLPKIGVLSLEALIFLTGHRFIQSPHFVHASVTL